VEAFVVGGAGFLLAVLWFDLMHDVQVRGHDPAVDLPESVLASIAGYYARVTTAARPMNRLVAAVMLATLVAVVVEIIEGLEPAWVPWVTFVSLAPAVGLAGRRTVPSAVRLGTRRDDVATQSALARSVYRDHRFCLVCITLVLIVQLGSAAR
jgi:hypothetical protein